MIPGCRNAQAVIVISLQALQCNMHRADTAR